MRCNEAGKAIIREAEGLRLEAYLCPAGKWTIGYGHTGADVHEGLVISEADADGLLSSDIKWAEEAVSSAVKVPITSNQFSALVDFTFNVGAGNFRSSTLLRKLNAGDVAGAAEEFGKWTKAGGKVLPGLVKRRAAGRDLFLSPDPVEV